MGGLVFLLFASRGLLRHHATAGRRRSNDVRWPIGALLVLALLGVAAGSSPRPSDARAGRSSAEEELAGYTAALLALAVVGLLVAATNPYALVFLLPCLHVWLWLPQVQARPRVFRALVLALGLIGPGVSRLDVRDAATGSAGMRRGTSRSSSRSVTRRERCS